MSAVAILTNAGALISAGQDILSLVARSIEAANNGDQATADALLEAARQRYADARKNWDDTAAPSA